MLHIHKVVQFLYDWKQRDSSVYIIFFLLIVIFPGPSQQHFPIQSKFHSDQAQSVKLKHLKCLHEAFSVWLQSN